MICSALRFRCLNWLICLSLLLAVGQALPATGQEDRLSPEGPWLVYSADDGLVAANQDGSGRTLLAPSPDPDTEFLVFPSPTGDRFLLVTALEGKPGSPPRADLRLVQLPGGGRRALLPSLLPPGPGANLLAPLLLDALRRGDGLAWASAGDRVAFATAHLGQPTLIIFNLGSGTSTSLTGDGALPADLHWAAHGRHLLWEAHSLDGRSAILGASFASASGRVAAHPPATLSLALPALDGWDFVGWQTPDRALFSARQSGGTLSGLAAYDFTTGESTALLPANLPLTAAAVLGDTLLFSAAPGASLPAGVYRLVFDGTWTLLQPGPASAIRADSTREAFWISRAEGNLLIPAAGGAAQALPLGTPYPAAAGTAVAYLHDEAGGNDSLWLAPLPADQPILIWPGQAGSPTWSADGRTLYAIRRPATDDQADQSASGLAAITADDGRLSFLDSRAVPGALAVLTPRALTLLADRDVPLLDAPNPTGAVIGVLAGDEPIARLTGRNRAGDWLAIQLGDGRAGWIRLDALTTTVSTGNLPILRD